MTIDVRTMTTEEIVKNHYQNMILASEVVESEDMTRIPTMRESLVWLTTVSELWVSDPRFEE